MPRLSSTDRARLRAAVRDRIGLELPDARLPRLERAVQKVLDGTALLDVSSLCDALRDDGGSPAVDAFLADLTIGETHFWRHRAQFDALEHRVLPELVARRRADRRLRLWSAGCASGEEPYSLAILLDRVLPDVQTWDVTLIATDIDRAALERARRGLYGRWSLRGVPDAVNETYFSVREHQAEIDPRLRHSVRFGYLNLVDDAYPSAVTGIWDMDLILCRNVLMYFSEQTCDRVVARLYDALAPGGWLVVGHAESCQRTFKRFDVHNAPGTVLYQKRDPAEAPPERAPTAHPSPPARAGRTFDAPAAYRVAKRHADARELDAATRWADAATGADPLFAPAHYLRGLILQEQGRAGPAAGCFRRCIYADPQFALGHFALGVALLHAGERDRAYKALDNAERLARARAVDAGPPASDGIDGARLLEMIALQRRAAWQDRP